MIRWRLLYCVALATFGLLVGTAACLAHSQAGPPYLMINGVYADTNPISGAAPELIPQDYTPNNSYVAGVPIEFAIDLARIGVPTEFQWQWAADQTSWEPGSKLTHIYAKPGSYLITLQAKNELTNNTFIAYDTVQVNVVPRAGYTLPSAKVSMSYTKASGGYDVILTAQGSHDSSTAVSDYSWLLGDGEQASGQSVHHTYQSGFARVFPILLVKDKYGLSTAVAFELDQSKSIVSASSLPFMPGIVTTAKSGGLINPHQIITLLVLAVVLMAGLIGLSNIRRKA